MKITDTNIFFGPNQYLARKSVCFHLDMALLDQEETTLLDDGFLQNFAHQSGEIFSPDDVDTMLAAISSKPSNTSGYLFSLLMEQLAINILKQGRHSVAFSEVQFGAQAGLYRLLLAYEESAATLQAGRLAFAFISQLFPPTLPFAVPDEAAIDFHKAYQSFIQFAQPRAYSVSRRAIQTAAARDQIPFLELDHPPFVDDEEIPPVEYRNAIQLGYGSCQRRLRNTLLANCKHNIYVLFQHRQSCNRYLHERGIPVARQDPEFSNINNSRRAVRSAQRIGFPVTLKPLSVQSKSGVMINLKSPEQVATAYRHAQKYNNKVVVEAYIPGTSYQLLLINGEITALVKRQSLILTGDGQQSIANLIAKCAVETEDCDAYLAICNGQPEHRLAAGEQLLIAANSGPRTVITDEEITQTVHSSIISLAIEEIKKLQLTICAVNFISKDISRPLQETGGVVTGFDLAPDLTLYQTPHQEIHNQAAEQLVSALFPEPEHSRIPIIAVTGTNGKTTTTRMLAHILKTAGIRFGLACTDGIYNRDTIVHEGTYSGVSGAQTVLSYPDIDAAIIEISRGTLAKNGLGFDFCHVGVCTNIANDHLGLEGINTLEELAALKRLVISYSRDMAVLNADDPLCVSMVKYTKAKRLCLTTMNAENPAVKKHIADGAPALVLDSIPEGKCIAFYTQGIRQAAISVDTIPATISGKAEHNIENAMFAIAAALGLDIAWDTISAGMQTLMPSFEQIPGRLNSFPGLPFQVILDNAHNAHSFNSLCKFTDTIMVQGKRILVLAIPGDRRDCDFAESAAALAGHFDIFVCRDTKILRNRQIGEAPALLRDNLIREGVPAENILTIPDLEPALAKALEIAQPNDLLVNTGARHNESWEQLQQYSCAQKTP